MTRAAEASRRLRESSPEYVSRNASLNRARSAALYELARRFPREFNEVYERILRRRGLWPLHTPGRKPRAAQ
jgi:hypothetical protein